MCDLYRYLRQSFRAKASDAIEHIDALERTRIKKMEQDLERIKRRIDPLAEFVESIRDEGVRQDDRR